MLESNVLCQYQQAEDKGVALLIQLREFAPDSETVEEISRQIEDEKRHTKIFAGRLKDLDIDCEGLKHSLTKIYDLAQGYVDQKDWVLCIAIQTVIEELAMSTFTEHYNEQDAETKAVLDEIIEDEARHLAFGIAELAKVVEGNEEKIRTVHLKVMGILMEVFDDSSYTKAELKILLKTVSKAYKMHKARLAKIGLELPKVKALI